MVILVWSWSPLWTTTGQMSADCNDPNRLLGWVARQPFLPLPINIADHHASQGHNHENDFGVCECMLTLRHFR